MEILQSNLLSHEGLQLQCSTVPFLLGTASALLSLCGKDLVDHFAKLGNDAFDVRFLTESVATPATTTACPQDGVGMLGISSKERRLFASAIDAATTSNNQKSDMGDFKGTTECFFLTAALLRVSVFVAIRRFEEYHQKHRHDFAYYYDFARTEDMRASAPLGAATNASDVRLPVHLLERFGRRVSVDIGWHTFKDEPEFNSMVTRFCLLQLEWLVSIANCKTKTIDGRTTLSCVPEWFCKLPAQWITKLAKFTPHR